MSVNKPMLLFGLIQLIAITTVGAVDIARLQLHQRRALLPQIIGGIPADEGEFPSTISLRRNDFFGRTHFCAGSLISADVVLTAAHCLDGMDPIGIWAVGGAHLLEAPSGYEQEIQALELIIHKDYDEDSVVNDIGIVKLAAKMNLNDRVKIVELPPVNAPTAAGTAVTVAGWGEVVEGGGLSNCMMKATFPVVSDQQCREFYGETEIVDSMLCAGDLIGGADACQGDSGGPLMLKNGYLVGIVSWGFGCATPNYPGVYTEVSSFIDWISQHLS